MLQALVLYSQLVQQLKGPILDHILEHFHADGSKHAERIRFIAQLPQEAYVSIEDMRNIVNYCLKDKWLSRMDLHLPLYELMEALPSGDEEHPGLDIFELYGIRLPTFSEYRNLSSTDQMQCVYMTSLRSGYGTGKNIELKGVCPYCNNDLVQVIENYGPGKQPELRLRCRKQTRLECQSVDWFVGHLERR